MKLSPFRHYFFYAKGHYKQSSLYEDLRRIQCEYVGCSITTQLTMDDLIRVTTRAVDSVMAIGTAERYAEFLLEYGRIYKGGFQYEYASLKESILLANLGILRHCSNEDIARKNGECLGEPDFTILPIGY